MTAGFKVTRTRRTYNKWVANQTLEDFALRFTAHRVRKWSAWRIANTAIGAVSFLALEAIGGTLTLNYGFETTFWAVVSSCFVIFLLGIPISYNSAKYGVDIDLLTRGAGFGYLGSTVTSLIYASFTFIFFSIEAAIMAAALELCFGIPLAAGYLVSALLIIPLVIHGITFINRFQAWTQPFWLCLQVLPFVYIGAQSLPSVREWTGYTGLLGPVDGTFSLPLFGAASAVVFSVVAQIGEQVDYLRFLPRKLHTNRVAWWTALLAAGPGWVVIGALKMLAGSFLAYYAFESGVAFHDASEPTQMYLTVFRDMVASPEFALALTGIFVVLCQVKINVTNTYAGSIAWSNFFSRLTHSHPGRVVWVVFNVVIGVLLMQFGVYKGLEQVLGLYAIIAGAWLAAIVSDLTINKPLGLSPRYIEFKRAHLYDINPVGFGAVAIAILLSLMSYLGWFGSVAAALYAHVAIGSAILLAPLIAVATGGRYYLARTSSASGSQQTLQCCVCEHSFEVEDMAACPVYRGPICSLCCSLDAHCGDRCKENARFAEQIGIFARAVFPPRIASLVSSRIGTYLGILLVVSAVIALVLLVVYYQSTARDGLPPELVSLMFLRLFVIIFVIAAVMVWLFVLAHESRVFAEDEARRHTTLLMDEIEAHEETDRLLQKAKEAAESANQAKSKYIVGLSHELRTPLNSILGYAQLLNRRDLTPEIVANAARTIKRSGEHLVGLIEGLLDISKIEAGRMQIYRDKTALRPYLDQLVDMFSLQAAEKDIRFVFEPGPYIPDYVYTDEKRLRQILINLLSNAVKFTEAGQVSLRVTYRSQIAIFEIEDTGPGIAAADIERIFLPFERIEDANGSGHPPGTGLGLTITKLLVEIMGGGLSVKSDPGVGTVFTVRLMLGAATRPDDQKRPAAAIAGLKSGPHSVLIADDDPVQRALITDILVPLGFEVTAVPNGPTCLEALNEFRPDILLLDVAMPGLSGWQVARIVREGMHPLLPIVMISADAGNERNLNDYRRLHDGYLIKPFSIDDLVEQLSSTLDVEWNYHPQQVLRSSGVG
ncbi:hybrid sensor histidine kinase/response regulator [Paramesorhizobium deserti]|uniref:histidine kinase n=1 Tax=Paramesorhizobium deserti TaxID=1494590 RepID=A0A135HQE3_9HYPH|nr:ATP-binding protein [Paramesorhizobium deserti]KXF75424.1 hybrid sensor histidine kinase/response regulator [Paramesorhizobium deserti]